MEHHLTDFQYIHPTLHLMSLKFELLTDYQPGSTVCKLIHTHRTVYAYDIVSF